MPVNHKVPLKVASAARRIATFYTDSAQEDLQNAISCVMAACDSDRPDFLEACADEFLASVVRKLRMALSVACASAHTVPKSEPCQMTAPESSQSQT